jgi:hypothetical protein
VVGVTLAVAAGGVADAIIKDLLKQFFLAKE